ncbi:MAG: hypothetical protein GY729_05325 [Desulfobacteraceae bacterium]|nr:hypothetical protein [Desulfobacteraceae bacterium]
MKTIEVKITAEFEIPDDWEVVDHTPDVSYPENQLKVIKIDNQYYDFFPECLMKIEDGKKVFWSADEGKTEDIIDCMNNFNVMIKGKA